MRQQVQTARTLEAEWRQVLWGSVGKGTKACSRLVHVLKLMNHLFI
jgi:hypothetical protein